jgi:probable HAF family extracellular repeat protein
MSARQSHLILMALTALTVSCRDAAEPLAPPMQAGKAGGSGSPTVGTVVPDQSERGLTLNVTINGSGFDQGSVARFERQGAPVAGVTTNSTTYVTSRKLIASITIAVTADTGKYDVAVTTSGGRKGVGIERFTVLYQIAELGILGGTWSRAHAINNRGEVVGESCTQDCFSTAFYWSEATGQVDLGGLPGYTRSGAFAINSRGQIFGAVDCRPTEPGCGATGLPTKLVRWDKVGGSWTITPMNGCSLARPVADNTERFLINNNDQCVKHNGLSLAVQTISGAAVVNEVPLPSLYSDGVDHANAISDALMVAGFSGEVIERYPDGGVTSTMPEPVVWYRRSTGVWTVLRLGFPSTDVRAFATDIGEPDAAGRVRVTGYTEASAGSWRRASLRAVRWTLQGDGLGGWQVVSMEVLESGGPELKVWPIAVNTTGEIVGLSGDYVENGSPFKWSLGGVLEALPVPSGGNHGRAMDINDQGWIVGAVWDNVTGCDRAAIWRQQ